MVEPWGECIKHDCSDVSREKYVIVHGYTCYCHKDIQNANKYYEERLEKDYRRMIDRERLIETHQNAKQLDYDEFNNLCKKLDELLISGALRFDQDLWIMPYVRLDVKKIMYLMNDGAVENIVVTSDILMTLGKWQPKLLDPEKDYSFNMASVPAMLAEAVRVNLCIRHGIDVSRILKNDNPIYISKRCLCKHLDVVYGWNYHMFKKAREEHLELTEIVSGDNIIFIRQEIDEIVRRQALLQNA